jgi:DNA-binding transcriptional LysR family regulator
LTAAGEVFLTRCKQLLLDLSDGVLQAQRAHRGEVGSFVVGFIPTGMNDLFTVILPEFRKRHPDIQLTVRSYSTAAQLTALRDGELDVGVLRLPVSDSRVEVRSVFREPLMVALPSSHPLAQHRSVPLAAIASEPQISFPRQFAPEYHAFLEGLFESIGATFQTYQEAEQFSVHLGLIAGGLGIGLIPGSSRLKLEGVMFRRLTHPEVFIETGVAVMRGRQAPLIEDFLEIARKASELKAQ